MQNCNVSWSFNVRGIYERNHCYIQVSCSEFFKVLAQNLNLHFFSNPPQVVLSPGPDWKVWGLNYKRLL